MLENPGLPEAELALSLYSTYSLAGCQVTFLPLGYDVNTAVYRVETLAGTAYFLKLRRGIFNPITVEIPYHLDKLGIKNIISPILTASGNLFGEFSLNHQDYSMVLYPFMQGKDGYQQNLTSRQWIELGRTFQQLHHAHLPGNVISRVPHETYDPVWRESVKEFLQQVDHHRSSDPVAEKLSAFMLEQRGIISLLVERAEQLAGELKKQPLEQVLCHADAHPGNFLITETGRLYLVDWDNPEMAPRERDLMFFGGGMSGDRPGGEEESLFYQGYGAVEVNRKALAYYRYERIIQDIAEFCKQLLLSSDGGEDREQAYGYFTSSFLPGHVIEAALYTDAIIDYGGLHGKSDI